MLHIDDIFPRLTTSRLLLRKMEVADAPEIFRLRSDEAVNRYIERPRARTIEDGTRYIHTIKTGIHNKELLYWAIALQQEKSLCGTICLWNLDHSTDKAEIGFELLPDYQGKGIMTEATGAVLDFAFTKMNAAYLEAWTHQQNEASLKVLSRKNFQRDEQAEIQLKPPAQFGIYRLHKKEWQWQ